MSQPIISVQNVSKCYLLGETIRHDTLRDRLADAVKGWLKRPAGETAAAKQTASEFWALKDVSFDIHPGEVVGIIGRNGAGKSTLLKILSQITEPTSGEIRLRGRIASLLEVGTGFHPELTGRENVFLNGAILGMSQAEIRKKFDEIVAFAEIEKFLDTPVKRYSSGMYVRLAFAVAAHLDPEILIVDEVLAVGDAQFQEKCLQKISNVAREGKTILIVSHNMAMITNLCQKAVLLKKGSVAMVGAPHFVTDQYLRSSGAGAGEVVWDKLEEAPGNAIVKLQSVRITQGDDHRPKPDVEISRDINVEITYWNQVAGEKLYAALWLRDQLGTVVFASGSQKSMSAGIDPWYGRECPVGSYRSVCSIPANLLNEGRYSITAIVGRGLTDTQILQEWILDFEVHDTGEMRKEYYGKWIGVIRPRLPWVTEKIA